MTQTGPDAEFEVGQTVYLDGRDPEATPPLTVGRINIWDGVLRQRALRQWKHGTRAKVIERRFCAKERRWYYRLRYRMKTGWVPGTFLSAEKPGVLGDLVLV